MLSIRTFLPELALPPVWAPPPPSCPDLPAAEAALERAQARLWALPVGGGRDATARALLVTALEACPGNATVLEAVGEGLRALQEPKTALAVFARGARGGLYHHPLQRILTGFDPHLRSAMVLSPEAWEELPELHEIHSLIQSHWASLRAEFLRARRSFDSGYVQIQHCPGERCWNAHPPRWRQGTWGHYYVAPKETPPDSEWYWNGESELCNWAAFPKLCGLLMHLRHRGFEITQVAVTEVREPVTFIPAHHSQQWRLRLVCPLVVPKNATSQLRFPGFGYRLFLERQCFWFDESYEHEQLYRGPSYRSALVLDLKHPGLDRRPPRGSWAVAWWNRTAATPGSVVLAAERARTAAIAPGVFPAVSGSPAVQPSQVRPLRVPLRRAFAEPAALGCWQNGRSPGRCCYGGGSEAGRCWQGSESLALSFGACCGTLPQLGASIPRFRGSEAVVREAACIEGSYEPSALEAGFVANAKAWTSNASAMCGQLDRGTREAWLQQVRGLAPPSPRIFSRLCRRGGQPQYLEPLAGLLRDPRLLCEGASFVFSVDWLLFADASLLQPGARRVFLDAGGSRFADALGFFLAEYRARGIEFDEVVVWEAQPLTEEDYWAGTAPEVRAAVASRLTLHLGQPVVAENGARHNPIARLEELCQPSDFCVFKLDIDRPALEARLVEQLADLARRRGPLADEFFFEHHVRGAIEHFGKRYGWGWVYIKPEETPTDTFADSYALFSRLRQLGIRAHSWI